MLEIMCYESGAKASVIEYTIELYSHDPEFVDGGIVMINFSIKTDQEFTTLTRCKFKEIATLTRTYCNKHNIECIVQKEYHDGEHYRAHDPQNPKLNRVYEMHVPKYSINKAYRIFRIAIGDFKSNIFNSVRSKLEAKND